MSVRSNAEGREQERAVARYAAHLGEKAKRDDYTVTFFADSVVIMESGEPYQFEPEEFYRWVDAVCPRDASGPILPLEADANPSEGESAEPVVESEEEPEITIDPSPQAEWVIENSSVERAFHELVHAMFEVLRQEHEGEIGRNAARFRKGEVMTVVEQFKERAKEEQLEGLTTTKDILAALNSGLLAFANSQGIVDKFNRITENEATITRTVFERFARDGLSTRFQLVDAVDDATGLPLVADDGEPITLPITEVAVNNLYPLAEYATELNADKLASFAHRFSEKVVKSAKKLSKDRSIPILEVVDGLNRLRRTITSPITENEVSVQADETLALTWIREQRGEEPPSEIINITTTRDWYESEYKPLKAVATLVYATFGLPLNEDGEISNVKLLERLITQYFSVNENGPNRLLAALVDAEDISEAQAQRFLTRFQWDVEQGQLVEQELTEEQARELAEATATGIEAGGEPIEQDQASDPFEFDGGFELDLDVTPEPPAVTQAVSDESDDDFDDDF